MELVLALDDTNYTLKICDHHHGLIKNQLDLYGLSDLIVKDESDVFGIIQRALEGTFSTKDDFDPLLMMDFLIWYKSIQFEAETSISLSVKDGETTCILCEYERHGHDSEEWISEAICHTVDAAKSLGFFSVQ